MTSRERDFLVKISAEFKRPCEYCRTYLMELLEMFARELILPQAVRAPRHRCRYAGTYVTRDWKAVP